MWTLALNTLYVHQTPWRPHTDFPLYSENITLLLPSVLNLNMVLSNLSNIQFCCLVSYMDAASFLPEVSNSFGVWKSKYWERWEFSQIVKCSAVETDLFRLQEASVIVFGWNYFEYEQTSLCVMFPFALVLYCHSLTFPVWRPPHVRDVIDVIRNQVEI